MRWWPTIRFACCRSCVTPDQGFATLAAPLTIEPIGIALPPNDALLVNLVQNYLNALAGTGALEALSARWFEDASWLDQLP